MFDTSIVVIGNVLNAPEWRRTSNKNLLVTTFRVASTARWQDRETGQWRDGNQLRVRVSCWRRLAEGVASSVTVGDPVVVSGRLYTRDWTDTAGNLRTSYEMEAYAVGHDLSRGRAKFFRNKNVQTDEVETPERAERVRGQAAVVVAEDEVPMAYGEGVPEVDEPTFDETPALGAVPVMAALRGGGFEPFDTTLALPAGSADGEDSPESEESTETEDEPDEETSPDSAQEPEGAPGKETGTVLEPVEIITPSPKRVRNRVPRRQPVAA
ncbi:hypothetical protein GCM10010435_51200 [Winogradskya consettensis]|uniref:Single-stranded DNA-binding protein n=1 Tax=Winogradskya consettensis TaxID=113560 RepID=A0A919SHJ7_9ACTN|nr:single-stranded DNA-binding protein [Actinoplanes consettensis]GIM72020.1 hypothetical protein Aco04nite_28230 [Actinoplanes consettensis]